MDSHCSPVMTCYRAFALQGGLLRTHPGFQSQEPQGTPTFGTLKALSMCPWQHVHLTIVFEVTLEGSSSFCNFLQLKELTGVPGLQLHQ